MPDDDGQPQISWVSERHLRLAFDPDQVRTPTESIEQTLAALQRDCPPGLIERTPAAATILLEFEPEQLDESRVIADVCRALRHSNAVSLERTQEVIEIPVCYEPSCAPDAAEVARIQGISHDDLIRLHAEADYSVEFIGFAPGFGYLNGLPARLNTPRLDSPRTRVPPGSVGIAGNQTCVYPGNTAGGWRLIGRTPLRMFDTRREKPSLLARGDRVRFVPISLAEYQARGAG